MKYQGCYYMVAECIAIIWCMTAVFFFFGGGAFIGNHVHKALEVKCTCAMHVYVNNSVIQLKQLHIPNIQTQCISISKMAQEKLPHRSGEVASQVSKFITAFCRSLYGKCHNICDQNFIDATQAHALD